MAATLSYVEADYEGVLKAAKSGLNNVCWSNLDQTIQAFIQVFIVMSMIYRDVVGDCSCDDTDDRSRWHKKYRLLIWWVKLGMHGTIFIVRVKVHQHKTRRKQEIVVLERYGCYLENHYVHWWQPNSTMEACSWKLNLLDAVGWTECSKLRFNYQLSSFLCNTIKSEWRHGRQRSSSKRYQWEKAVVRFLQ